MPTREAILHGFRAGIATVTVAALRPSVAQAQISPEGIALAERQASRRPEIEQIKKSLRLHATPNTTLNGFLVGAFETYLDSLTLADDEKYAAAIQRGQSVEGNPEVTINYGEAIVRVRSGDFAINSITLSQDDDYAKIVIDTAYIPRFGASDDAVNNDLKSKTLNIFYLKPGYKTEAENVRDKFGVYASDLDKEIGRDFSIRASVETGHGIFTQHTQIPKSA